MRILLVTHRFPPDGVGGVERHVERLATELRSAGEEVSVLTRTPKRFPRQARLEYLNGAERIVGAGVRVDNFLVGARRTENLFAEHIQELDPDVVHIHHLIGISPRVIEIAHEHGVAVAWSLHDYWSFCPLVHLVKRSGVRCAGPDGGAECARTCFSGQRDSFRRWSLRYRYFSTLLRIADRVVVPSASLAARVRAMQPDAGVEVIPLGTDVPRDPPGHGQREQKLRVGYVGSVVPHKGLRTLARSLALVPAEVDCFIAGRVDDGSFRKELSGLAAGRIRWHGEFGPAELDSILGRLDVLIAPSLVPEVFPLVPREALSRGVPVIGAAVPGIDDVVQDGRNGLLVTPGDAESLAAAIGRVATDPALLESLAAGASATPMTTWDDHLASVRAMYRRISGVTRATDALHDNLNELHVQALAAGFGHR